MGSVKWNLIIFAIVLVFAGIFITRKIGISDIKYDRQIEKYKQELLYADKNFYQTSIKIGTPAAFMQYAADEAVILRENNLPLEGKISIVNIYSRQEKNSKLRWNPLRADVSRSGDLGYTFGKWDYLSDSDKIAASGFYVTIWKKQDDGSWKYVVDGGSTNPGK